MKHEATLQFAVTAGNSATSAKQEPSLTPYLKAILTGAVSIVKTGKAGIASRHDLDAATRYIRESASLKK